MSTVFCPECGAEYLEGYTECADCLVPLVPSAQPRGADVGEDDDVVYELDDWEPDLLEQLNKSLAHEGIPHTWEEDRNLVVPDAYSDRVEELLDELEYPDALDPTDDDGGDDEAAYDVVSDLYVAADRLMHAPDDVSIAGDLVQAADAADGIQRPFGFSPDEWNRIKAMAAAVRDGLSREADDEVIAGDARSLRELLSRYV